MMNQRNVQFDAIRGRRLAFPLSADVPLPHGFSGFLDFLDNSGARQRKQKVSVPPAAHILRGRVEVQPERKFAVAIDSQNPTDIASEIRGPAGANVEHHQAALAASRITNVDAVRRQIILVHVGTPFPSALQASDVGHRDAATTRIPIPLGRQTKNGAGSLSLFACFLHVVPQMRYDLRAYILVVPEGSLCFFGAEPA
jgi:hypothetical protein